MEQETNSTQQTNVEVETQSNTSVEDTSTTASNVEEDIDTDDVDFDDEDSDTEEESTTETDSTKTNETKTTKQNSKTNKQFAQKRREEEQRKRELELEKQGYNRGIKESIGGVNPYTHEKIETDDDLQDYLDMKEMESKGLDPNDTKDYRKFKREKAEQEKLAQVEKEKQENELKTKANEKASKDMAEFKGKYPTTNIAEVLKNDNASKIIKGQIALGSTLLEAYEFYNSIANQPVLDKAKKIAEKQAQVSQTSVGSQTEGDSVEGTQDFTKLKVGTKEFKDYVDKVKRGLIK